MCERQSRLSLRQQSGLIKLLVAGATARTAGELAGVHRNTAVSYFMRLRHLLPLICPVIACQERLKPMKAIWAGSGKENAGAGQREK